MGRLGEHPQMLWRDTTHHVLTKQRLTSLTERVGHQFTTEPTVWLLPITIAQSNTGAPEPIIRAPKLSKGSIQYRLWIADWKLHQSRMAGTRQATSQQRLPHTTRGNCSQKSCRRTRLIKQQIDVGPCRPGCQANRQAAWMMTTSKENADNTHHSIPAAAMNISSICESLSPIAAPSCCTNGLCRHTSEL